MTRVGDHVQTYGGGCDPGLLYGIVVGIGKRRAVVVWESETIGYYHPEGLTRADFSDFTPTERSVVVLRLRTAQVMRLHRLPIHDGLCPAGLHGLDHEGQKCDLCAGRSRK